MPLLADSYTVYAIDLPGFGDSPVNRNEEYNQRYMTKAISDFITKNKISKLTLAGVSIGGVLYATIASTSPNKVNHIFVLNPYDYDIFLVRGSSRQSVCTVYYLEHELTCCG